MANAIAQKDQMVAMLLLSTPYGPIGSGPAGFARCEE
jgi:hypothetical protein